MSAWHTLSFAYVFASELTFMPEAGFASWQEFSSSILALFNDLEPNRSTPGKDYCPGVKSLSPLSACFLPEVPTLVSLVSCMSRSSAKRTFFLGGVSCCMVWPGWGVMGELDFKNGRGFDRIMIEVKYAFIFSCVSMLPEALGISALVACLICRLFFGFKSLEVFVF